MQIQFDDIRGGEGLLRQLREEEFVDDAFACDAPTGLFWFPAGWVATTTRHERPSESTGTSGQSERLRTIWLCSPRLDLISRQVQTCLNQRVIEHAGVFASGHKREPSHIGEDGSGAILPVEPRASCAKLRAETP